MTPSTVLIINHSVQNCGVYQYGKRFGNILVNSTNTSDNTRISKYLYVYLESNSQNELLEAINRYHPCAIIYNYLSVTMSWACPDFTQKIRSSLNIKQFVIVHNEHYSHFDYYLHQDPYYSNVDEKNFAVLRPLFNYVKIPSINDGVTRIGSFGFGSSCRRFDELCKLVNSQFNDGERIDINLHITKGYYSKEDIDAICNSCYRSITRDTIQLNFSHNFMSDSDVLDFLNKNDLNIFLYDNYNFYNGISSTIDYALSVKKPIAICKSNMFSHIIGVTPSICIEDLPLTQIIKNGFTPLEDKYNSWTPDKFVNHIDKIFDRVFPSSNCSDRSFLGVFFTMFNEKDAVEYSLRSLNEIYPQIPIYLVSEGIDMSFLQDKYNLRFSLEEDTMGATFKISGDNYTEPVHQETEKKCALAVIKRLKQAIDFCNSEYILMMDPDALVRGKLTIPAGVKLLGSRINCGFSQGYKDILSEIPGAKVINHWGATPAIFHVQTFLKGIQFLEANMDIFDRLCLAFCAMYAHDVLLPTIFAFVGEEETFNPDIIECYRDRNWESKSNPLVHQFRKYYPKRT